MPNPPQLGPQPHPPPPYSWLHLQHCYIKGPLVVIKGNNRNYINHTSIIKKTVALKQIRSGVQIHKTDWICQNCSFVSVYNLSFVPISSLQSIQFLYRTGYGLLYRKEVDIFCLETKTDGNVPAILQLF